jgi:ComF family protein
MRGEDDPENQVEKLFWGKVNLHASAAMLHFSKGGKVQRMLHRIKYRGDHPLAHYLGERMAIRLSKSDRFAEFDMVIPVPLHPHKERARGFNQSALLAAAIAEKSNRSWSSEYLVRTVRTSTQTNKDRMERWDNVRSVFQVRNARQLDNKRVLLIDDVITTGATLEGCVRALQNASDVKISVYTAAVA